MNRGTLEKTVSNIVKSSLQVSTMITIDNNIILIYIYHYLLKASVNEGAKREDMLIELLREERLFRQAEMKIRDEEIKNRDEQQAQTNSILQLLLVCYYVYVFLIIIFLNINICYSILLLS
jgi:hypothetical protein